ncbi:MAG: hypothetical protein JWO37_3998 [Acidimicrobiales bacterium]|jgi:hypothetical protein|nr:hypothetical protein [Acidimicrobiales bacterium]
MQTVALRRTSVVGARLELLVLAAEPRGCVAVDLASGAFVRARYPIDQWVPLAPFDVAVAEIAEAEHPADVSRPESIDLAAAPARNGRMSPRRAERWLKALHQPRGQVVLGFPGPAAPYWTLTGDRPSVTLVDAPVGLHAVRDPEGFRVRLPWRGTRLDLPLADHHLAAALDDLGRARIGSGDLQRVLGFRPKRVLAVLTPPFRGYCYKVAAALLPTR